MSGGYVHPPPGPAGRAEVYAAGAVDGAVHLWDPQVAVGPRLLATLRVRGGRRSPGRLPRNPKP